MITDTVKISILTAKLSADLIIGTPLGDNELHIRMFLPKEQNGQHTYLSFS